MIFGWTEAETAFRQRLQDFLAATLPDDWERFSQHGPAGAVRRDHGRTALRHRLAEAQVRTNGVYWLAMKAAGTLDPADAALAALHAQESARAGGLMISTSS